MAVRVKPGTKLLIVILAAAAALFISYRDAFHPSSADETKTSSGALTGTELQKKTRFTLALSEWPGHMPFVIGNGGLTTRPGSTAAANALDLEIVFIEDASSKNAALQSRKVDFIWQTVDEMPLSLAGFKKAGTDVRAFLQLDWSRGGDACVGSPDVQKVEDLLGRKSAMLMFSPDHTLFEFMINNSRLTPAQIKQVRADTTFSMDDFTFGRALFAQGQVDLACLWEPDVSLALKSRPGSHVLFSTADATGLIADVLLTSKTLLNERPEIAQKLAMVWFGGVTRAETDRAAAAQLVATEVPRFRDELGYEATLKAFDWVKWTPISENARFFGLQGDPAFDGIYNQADAIWTKYPEAKLAERFVPAGLRDDRIVRAIWDASGGKNVPREQVTYRPELARSGTPILTKPITINFDKSSAELDAESLYILNSQIIPQLELARAMHIRIEGNSDSQGSTELNRQLSEKRAKSVSDYFISRGIEESRISYKGNGDSAPIASNKTSDGRAANRRTDILFISAEPR
jgi:outer membrane protein OmpA-like peptidoglycan-associated protein/ABC-type nitrate/sulfonate/bicarbonate transport system substrate-binding protein